ncbi:Putative ribonuclease H protein At1g65750 [Linum perenne]
MTNKERKRRHLTDNSDCGICVGTDESIDHVLRCCPFARSVWSKVNSNAHDPSFFLSNFKNWWEDNIMKPGGNINFGITCWILWRARNERAFQEATTSPDAILEQVKFWQGIILNAQEMAAQTRNLTSGVREMSEICWTPAPNPWTTLNTDGSLLSTGLAGAGGVLRTNGGQVICAFSVNLGRCSITRAEIRGVVEGMQVAWDIGIRKLAIQSDSTTAIRILHDGSRLDHQHANLTRRFRNMLGWNWEVTLSHVYRESNFLADSLASKAHSLPFGTHLVEVEDIAVARWSAYDRLRLSRPRLVLRPM